MSNASSRTDVLHVLVTCHGYVATFTMKLIQFNDILVQGQRNFYNEDCKKTRTVGPVVT